MPAIAARCCFRPARRRAGRSRTSAPHLASSPDFEFERAELILREGDALVFYTDGVTEAFNPQDECYGSERLLADAGAFAGQSAPDLTAGLLQKVRAFAGTAPQSDDIAILALRVGKAAGRAPRTRKASP